MYKKNILLGDSDAYVHVYNRLSVWLLRISANLLMLLALLLLFSFSSDLRFALSLWLSGEYLKELLLCCCLISQTFLMSHEIYFVVAAIYSYGKIHSAKLPSKFIETEKINGQLSFQFCSITLLFEQFIFVDS